MNFTDYFRIIVIIIILVGIWFIFNKVSPDPTEPTPSTTETTPTATDTTPTATDTTSTETETTPSTTETTSNKEFIKNNIDKINGFLDNKTLKSNPNNHFKLSKNNTILRLDDNNIQEKKIWIFLYNKKIKVNKICTIPAFGTSNFDTPPARCISEIKNKEIKNDFFNNYNIITFETDETNFGIFIDKPKNSKNLYSYIFERKENNLEYKGIWQIKKKK